MNQLEKINELLGTPTEADIWFVSNDRARNFMMKVLPKRRGVDMTVKFPGASAAALDLLRGLLAVDPRRRFDASAALDHPYLGIFLKFVYLVKQEQED